MINPDLENNEEHRIRYVAVRRARERLFINVPALSKENEEILKKMGFKFITE